MKKNNTPKKCTCSFCEGELKGGCFEPAFCAPCGVTVVCGVCGHRYGEDAEKCPQCGTARKKHGRGKKA